MSAQPDRTELLRQLTFIENPVARLFEALRHGLTEYVAEALLALIATAKVYFQHESRCREVNDFKPIGTIAETDEFRICIRLDDHRPGICFNPEGLRKVLGWSKKQLGEFMIEVVRRAISIDPRNLKSWHLCSWEVNATVTAIRQVLPKLHELRQEAELWCVRGLFFNDATLVNCQSEETTEKWLGRPVPDVQYRYGDDWNQWIGDQHRQDRLVETLVERLRALGMSDDEIREDFYLWLERCVNLLQPSLLTGVANSPIFGDDDRRRGQIMAGEVVHAMEYATCGGPLQSKYIVARLITGGLFRAKGSHEQAEVLFCQHLAVILANGRIGRVAGITAVIGELIMGEGFKIAELAARAFDLTWQAGNYGIAAALVNQFGSDACLDPAILRERAIQLAEAESDGESAMAKLEELVLERKTQIATANELANTTHKSIRLDYNVA